MDEVILHIGMHKTGTRSIQNSLQGYDRDGIRYADLGAPNHGSLIARAFDPDRQKFSPRMKAVSAEDASARSKAARQKLERELKHDHVRKLIISGEAIPYLPADQIDALKGLLEAYAAKITVIAYIREPVSFVSSMFQQLVRMGMTEDGIDMPLPHYRNKFEKFLSLFGEENVIFRAFAKEALSGGSAVSDFCAQAGIPAGAVHEVRLNDRLPLEALQLLNCFNRLRMFNIDEPQFIVARQNVIDLLAASFETPFRIDADEVRANLDLADIRWMEDISGFDLGSSGARAASPAAPRLTPQLDDIAEATIGKLRSELERLQISHTPHDDAATLVSRLFLHFLFESFPGQDMADDARDLALRLEKHRDFSLGDARKLMRIAERIRPTGKFIQKKLGEYDAKIGDKH